MTTNRLVRDIALTTGTLVMTAAGLMLTTWLLASGFGPTDFGVYSVLKRAVAIVTPFGTVALGIGLARFTAVVEDGPPRLQLLVAAIILGGVPTIVMALLAVGYAAPLGQLLLARPGYSSAVAAAGLLLLGSFFYTLLYAYYRGTGQMRTANLVLLINDCLGPIVVAAAYGARGNVQVVLALLAGLNCLSLIPLARYSWRAWQSWPGLRVKNSMRELARYGYPRVPGGVTFAGMLGAAPLLAAYTTSVEDAGYLVAGQAVFAIGDAAFAAFGVVLLPKAAQLIAGHAGEALRELVDDLFALSAYVGVFAAIHLLIWGDAIIRVWLGEEYGPAIPLLRILALGLVPYILYGVFRSIIDAVDQRAINVRHLYGALGLTVVTSLALSRFGSRGLAAGTAVGFGVLGLSTVRYLWRERWLSFQQIDVRHLVTLNLAAAAIAVACRYAIEPRAPVTALALGILVELLLFALYCAALRWLRVKWIIQFGGRVVTAA